MIFRNKYNRKNIEYASEIINNKLFVHPLWEAVPYSGNIDWHQNPYDNRTWCFYLHSLSPINHLIGAYELENNPKYLDKAKEIIISWAKFNNSTNLEPSEHAWKDHSTANRVVAIIFFWNYYRKTNSYDKNFEKELFSLLVKHGNFLFDDANYNHRNNHGVYQDRSLIELGVLFPEWEESTQWFNKAKRRLMTYIEKFVSSEGVHKEHSSAYHILMFKLLSEINEFLIYHNREIVELSEIIYNMEEYLAYIVKPDGKVPMTGDSGPDSISFLSKDDIKNPKLLYVRTNGIQGNKPSNDIVYKKDGIGIFRSTWTGKNPVYLKILSAFHSLAHKHADDLSFLLSIGHTDFFVDSGKYNYQEKDEYRKYFRSTLAHNSITVNRKSYELNSNQSGKSKIDSYGIKDNFSYVIASHTLYPGVVIKRTLLYLKSFDSILIHDQLGSSTQRTYSQIFNIGPNVTVNPLTKKKIILTSTVDSNNIELIQLNHVTEFKNYKGNTNPIFGWQSSEFNKKHPITQLQFSNKGADLEYKTIINLVLEYGVKYYSAIPHQNGITYIVTLKDNTKHNFEIKI